MKFRRLTLSVCVLVGVGMVGVTFTPPAHAALDKCQGGIQKTVSKLTGKILKGLNKCTDGYRKAIIKNIPLTGAGGPADKCNIELNKAIVYPDLNLADGTSAMQTAKNGLNALVTVLPVACGDTELIRLGHLPQGTFGDMWQRWAMLSALQAAYDQVTWETADTLNILTAFKDTPNCPLCAKVTTPPCHKHNCVLSGGSGANTYIPGAIAVPLTGEAVFEICKYADLTANDFMVIGNPNKTIDPTTVLGNAVCLRGLRAEGYISCPGSTSPQVNVTLCQDHTVQSGTDECTAGATFCQDDTPDPFPAAPHTGVTNGGPCATLTPTGVVSGGAFVLSTTQIGLVPPGDEGPDGIACTPDDTGPPTPANTIQLTTGSASAMVIDRNANEGLNITTPTVTGTPFSCPNVPTSNLSPGKLVGAFPALHTLCPGPPCDDPLTPGVEGPVPLDSATTFTIVCS